MWTGKVKSYYCPITVIALLAGIITHEPMGSIFIWSEFTDDKCNDVTYSNVVNLIDSGVSAEHGYENRCRKSPTFDFRQSRPFRWFCRENYRGNTSGFYEICVTYTRRPENFGNATKPWCDGGVLNLTSFVVYNDCRRTWDTAVGTVNGLWSSVQKRIINYRTRQNGIK